MQSLSHNHCSFLKKQTAYTYPHFYLNSLPQVIYPHIFSSLNRALYLYIFSEHCMIQTHGVVGYVFRTTVGSPAPFKERLPAPRETLIKASWRNIPL